MHLLRNGLKLIAIFNYVAIGTSSKLLHGGTILAFDRDTEQLQIVPNGSVLIEGNTITSILDNI